MRLLSIVLIASASFAGLASQPRLPPAQQIDRHELWDGFFQGCTRQGRNSEYLCACSATFTIDKCGGEPTLEAVEACMRGNVEAAVRECGAYGQLVTAGSVRTPPPMSPAAPEPPELARTTRLDRWNGSHQGCMRQATPAERRRAPSLAYTCACVATYIVNACAPTDQVSNDHVMRCINTLLTPQAQGVTVACDAYGSIRVR